MEDYPRNINELEARFSSEEACREYLFRLRWPDGFRCPRCRAEKHWPLRAVLLECGRCGYQTSVDGGYDFPGHPQAVGPLVSDDVVGDQPEEWSQCSGLAEGSGTGKLQDGLDVAAQIASRDGSTGEGPFDRPGGGGRDLHGWGR